MAKPVKVVLTLDQSQFKKGMTSARGEIQKTEKAGTSAFGNMKTAFAAIASAAAIQQIGSLGNAFQEITNKLKTVTPANGDVRDSFDQVLQIARDTRSGLEETADLYFRLSKASEQLGLSQDEITKVTTLFNKTLKNSGATSQEAASAILQFSQAMASGRLQGDEFRSLNETNSDLMDRLAKAIGRPRGELKQLAADGVITADILASALLESADDIDATFGQTTTTLTQSLTGVRNEFINLVGKIEEQTGLFDKIANLFVHIGNNLKVYVALAGVAFGAKVIRQIYLMVGAIKALNVATKLQAAAQAAVLALAGPAGWGILAVAAGTAGAAVYGLNKLLDDTEQEAKDAAGAMGELGVDGFDFVGPPAPPSGGDDDKSTQEKFEAEQEAARLKREQERAEKALGNEIARNNTKASELFQTNKASLQNKLDQIALETEMLGLSEKEKEQKRDIADLEADRADALAEIQGMTFSKDEAENQAIIAEKLAEINDLYDTQIQKVEDLTDAYDKASTEFDTGFMEAFENFRTMVEDNAAYGARIFQTLSDGWTNAILDFVETGKLSFKDLFKSLMTEIIKMQANKLFLSLFGAGGVFGDLFAGFFAAGGRIPQGKFGIAGETGQPEIVMGPATVIGTNQSADILAGAGGGASVSYTINAVDAPSFQQLVARDPAFIYNVVQVGARRQPR